MSVGFASPAWLWLLAVLVPFSWWILPRRASGLTLASTAGAAASFGAGRQRAARLVELTPLVLRTGAFTCIIVALAGPRTVRVYEEPRDQGIGIALAIDLSTSMWAEDMGAGVSRLEVAKSTALDFVRARGDDVGLVARGDDIGLVTFAGEALARLPLTHDGFVVQAAIEDLEVGLLMDGTDIAGAIAAGAGLLNDAPHPSKVLILVTDGAHNKAGVMPDLAARAAAAVDVTIYPVAIGQERGRDQQAMETVLTQAARITGGRYFSATDVSALTEIYREIDRLVQPSQETVERVEATPYGWLLALAGLALAVAAIVLRGSRWGVLP